MLAATMQSDTYIWNAIFYMDAWNSMCMALRLDPLVIIVNSPIPRRLDRCDRMIQNESRYPNGGNVYYVTILVSFLSRKCRNVARNLPCDVVHIMYTTVWVYSLTLGGVFEINACLYILFAPRPCLTESEAWIASTRDSA